MISQKFASLSNERIMDFMNEEDGKVESDDLLHSIESISDLWILANIRETYDEENSTNNIVDSDTPDVASPIGGEDTPGSGDRVR